ncbi:MULTISPECIES: ShlB/FhaC/HecB family hemolysin secretion/activation protein [unclassified Sphingobium]|uniref:ShlB/FhaC/HecB family hemolysin secretion/activation protein n=1 Tax=unclassified Sphingobium TaxID=2611147 RepID=UPI002224A072|nr:MULTISPECIES: ShlB/FhaC/HecB family hemolysin secretion/activation protein [unclassified Sphingobium]MCW2413486.1 hemolysin activation/secretion protein [Sphingobium sp. B8D3D]MCW2414214.1 hemolysin activation/secretion protein [Sphingobium sp. B8D3A]
MLSTSLALLGASAATAQTAIERSLPPVPVAPGAPIAAPNIVPASQDETPLGATLRHIVLLSGTDEPLASDVVPADGVDASRVPNLDRAGIDRALQSFIGQPLSRKLIAQIQAGIARKARSVGRPFVSLSTPAQEITSGVLQIRVTEFRVGDIKVQGADGKAAKAVRDGIRQKSGDPVKATPLAEDLDWLNRTPMGEVGARFAPAVDQDGVTDLTLAVRRDRPVRVYGGWSNGGSDSTGINRFFLGAMARLPLIEGGYASYQITGSTDFWYKDGSILRGQPRYVAQGGRLYIPTAPRQNIELTLSDALTNQVINADFSVRQRTREATLGYRSALSNLGLPAGFGDVLAGVEFKRQRRDVFFGQLTALSDSADMWQGLLGLSKGWTGNGRQLSVSGNLHVSPGGLSARSSGARLAELTNDRVTSDRYAYATLDVSGAVRLPKNFALTSQFAFQYTRRPLPLPAQIGVGGEGLARGYTADDGSYDRGFVLRNELRLPPFALIGKDDQLSPYLFTDVAHGRDLAARRNTTVASAGVGTDYRFGRHLSAGINSAWALKDGMSTRSGDWRLQARVTASF